MRRRTCKIPELLEVRCSRFMFSHPPAYWTETDQHELRCDKCGQFLIVLFAARNDPLIDPEDSRWWVPTAVTCSCLLPGSIALHESPKTARWPKREGRQLELLPKTK
jgi:hypothetical protein